MSRKSHDVRLIKDIPCHETSFKNLKGLDFYDLAEVFNLQAYVLSDLKLLPVKLAFLHYAKGDVIKPHAHDEYQIKWVTNSEGRIAIHDQRGQEADLLTNEMIALTFPHAVYSADVLEDTDLIVATLIDPAAFKAPV